MEKKHRPTREYIKLLLFIVGWIELFLFIVAALFGRVLGFKITFLICFWIGVIIIAVFLSIILMNFVAVGFQKLYFWFIATRRTGIIRRGLKGKSES